MGEQNNIEPFAYMMANEKMVSMLSMIDQTMEFMNEYGIKPDEAVKAVLTPELDRIRKWLETK